MLYWQHTRDTHRLKNSHTNTQTDRKKHTHIHAKKATQPNVPKAAHIHTEKYLGKQQAFSSIIGNSNTKHTLSHIPVEYTTIATACKQLIFSVMQQPSLTVSRVSNYTFICLSVVLKATWRPAEQSLDSLQSRTASGLRPSVDNMLQTRHATCFMHLYGVVEKKFTKTKTRFFPWHFCTVGVEFQTKIQKKMNACSVWYHTSWIVKKSSTLKEKRYSSRKNHYIICGGRNRNMFVAYINGYIRSVWSKEDTVLVSCYFLA